MVKVISNINVLFLIYGVSWDCDEKYIEPRNALENFMDHKLYTILQCTGEES